MKKDRTSDVKRTFNLKALFEEIEQEETDQQIGGSHYEKLAIQPIDFIIQNNLNFAEGNVIKYVARYKLKNGIEDLKKARHYIDILIENYEEK